MKVLELAVLYGVIGVGCATVVLVRRSLSWGSAVDAVLLLGFWPLYGPFLLARVTVEPEGGQSDGEIAFLSALRRAQGTPLADLLPDRETVAALGRRLRVAAGKVAEIDQLLRQPELCERAARKRLAQLAARGASDNARATAAMRIQNIRRLRRLRDRFARELEEIEELLTQLRTQAEVVRLAGIPDREARELVAELVARVEGLDRMLDIDEPEPLAGSAL